MVVVRLGNGRRCDRIQLAFVVHSIALSSLKVWVCLYVRKGMGVPIRTVWRLCNVMIVVVVNNCYLPLRIQFRNLAFVCDFVLSSSLVDAKVRIRSKGAGGVEPIRSSPFNGYTYIQESTRVQYKYSSSIYCRD
jgi:hypothetical protein